MSMRVMIGKVVRIEDATKRIVLAESIHGYGVYACEVGFSHKKLQVGDYVLVFVDDGGGNGHAIPLDKPPVPPDFGNNAGGLSEVRLWYGMRPSGQAPEQPLFEIVLKQQGVEVCAYAGTTVQQQVEVKADGIAMKGTKIELTGMNGQTTQVVVKGNPLASSQPKGGFSQILYCPFTGAPHTTDTLMP